MIELSSTQFSSILPIFKEMQACIPLQGVLENQHPARIFVNRLDQPDAAFVWDHWGYFYLAGEPENEEFLKQLSVLLDYKLLPASCSLGQFGFVLWPDTDAWEKALPELLPGRLLVKIFRRTFTFDPATFYEGRYWRPALPPGFETRPLDADILEREADLAAEIEMAWGNRSEFLQHGFGVGILTGDTLASVCYSIFLGSCAAEVNIFTAEPYRRRGLATLAAAGFIDACQKRGLRPNWECFWDNLPSRKLAENLGFKAQQDIPVYYWEETC